eukprot:UN31054
MCVKTGRFISFYGGQEGHGMKTPKEKQSIKQIYVRSVCLSYDGKFLFSTADDKTAKMWHLEESYCVETYGGEKYGHTKAVISACVTKSMKYLFTGSSDETVRCW